MLYDLLIFFSTENTVHFNTQSFAELNILSQMYNVVCAQIFVSTWQINRNCETVVENAKFPQKVALASIKRENQQSVSFAWECVCM